MSRSGSEGDASEPFEQEIEMRKSLDVTRWLALGCAAILTTAVSPGAAHADPKATMPIESTLSTIYSNIEDDATKDLRPADDKKKGSQQQRAAKKPKGKKPKNTEQFYQVKMEDAMISSRTGPLCNKPPCKPKGVVAPGLLDGSGGFPTQGPATAGAAAAPSRGGGAGGGGVIK
jgi:hypothetical protein